MDTHTDAVVVLPRDVGPAAGGQMDRQQDRESKGQLAPSKLDASACWTYADVLEEAKTNSVKNGTLKAVGCFDFHLWRRE